MRPIRWKAASGVAVGVLLLAAPAAAQDGLLQRQAVLDRMLTEWAPAMIDRVRESCAAGGEPASIAQRRGAGLSELPDVSDYCITALIRLGRDGRLSNLVDANGGALSPSLAFDQGFVRGYRQRERIAPNLPTMAALKTIAERCLSQEDTDTGLCDAAGYAYGARAASGEVVYAS